MSRQLFLEILDVCVEDARFCFKVGGQDFWVGRKDKGNVPDIIVRVEHSRFFRRALAEGSVGIGECFMNGDFIVENQQLPLFLEILLRNRLDKKIETKPTVALRILLTRLVNALQSKAHNVRRHYDVGNDLFESFLDSTLTYSCGYAENIDNDLESLQRNKLERICRKLKMHEGDKLVDIGCGWGGLLIHAAKHYGVYGTGVTLSKNQHEYAQAKVQAAGLTDKVNILLSDFNQIEGTFDKVVSVGMMEHVSRNEYKKYFQKISQLLKPRGLGLVHTIGANAPKNTHDHFIQKYIFPDSNQPRLSEITANLEKQLLPILDVENMARHYGFTMRRWLEKFRMNRDKLDPSRYDDAFKRMWEFYLSAGIAASFASDGALYQVLFTNDYTAPMPLQRV